MELTVAAVCDALTARIPEHECLVWRDLRLTWRDLASRVGCVSQVLRASGLGVHGSLATSQLWESPHDHVALYLRNGNAYLESMLAAFRARAAPFNVNYRYTPAELTSLLADARTRALVYQGAFADNVRAVLPRIPPLELLLRVDDGSGDQLLPGAMDYETAIAAAMPPWRGGDRAGQWDPDDLYILYTGGTTGRPKGVLWRQADFLVACLGLRNRDGTEFSNLAEVAEQAARGGRNRSLCTPPFMHGSGHWNAISVMLSGGTAIIQDRIDSFDPVDVLSVAAREDATSIQIGGDAFARPMADAIRQHGFELPSLRTFLNGGAPLSARVRTHLLGLLPHVQIIDLLGSSETGRQGAVRSSGVSEESALPFDRSQTAVVLSESRTRVLSPGEAEIGWLAQTGRIPRGYLGDAKRTEETFVQVNGNRMAVAGDRVRFRADGTFELLGRDSSTINSGGEKIFAEEVEEALKLNPSVVDALVVGRPSDRWGSEVVAIVELRPEAHATDSELSAIAATRIARYKLPKHYIRVDKVLRSPSGKPDYAWARNAALRDLSTTPDE